MPTPAETEALFAVIGLLPILRAKPTLHRKQFERAVAIPKDIRRRMASFLGSEAFSEARDLPEFDYDETLDLVSQGQKPEQVAALMAAVQDPELGSELLLRADRLQTWANGLIPRATQTGFMNLQVEPPDDSELGDFRRIWAVACDPMAVLDDLEDGSLSEDQVATVTRLYPALYAAMTQAVNDAGAQLAARRGKEWQPSPTKAALLAILKGEEPVDLDLARDVQAMFAAQEAQQQAALQALQKGGKGGGGAASEEPTEGTPGQEASAG